MHGHPQPSQPVGPVTSQWITANAGSGKTYQLTRQVVKLLLLGVPPERICCITFTKAAAGEMRSRVIAALRGLLLASDSKCREKVEELLEGPADATIMQRARLLFGQVLDSHSGGVQLTTIHGFCQQLLRAFPVEAGVQPHFTVADDAQSASVRQQVKQRLLRNPASMGPWLAESIALLAERGHSEQRFEALLKTVMERRSRWEAAFAGMDMPTYRTRLYKAIGAQEGVTEQDLLHAAMHGFTAGQLAALRAALPELQSDKSQYLKDFAAGVEAWLATPTEQWENLQAPWMAIWKNRNTHHLRKRAQKHDTAGNQAILHGIALAERYLLQCADLALAEESFAMAVFASAALDAATQIKAERGWLDYEDLIVATRKLLTQSGMVGWVMSKLDHRIDHLLIDEAQDTSSEQWRIAHALVEELVASTQGVGAGGVPRSLFVVGDEKQSIYSFQGAAPELYGQKQQELASMLAPTPSPLHPRALLHSYRSARMILRVVDQVAQLPYVAAALSSEGMPQPHLVKQDDLIGSVTLHPLVRAEEKAEQPAFQIPVAYQITRSAAQILAETVTAQVQRMLGSGHWQAGDILILTRNRHPIVLPLLRCLQRAGVPVAGMDRLVLSEHLAVRDLLALMRVCAHRGDDLALAQVLRSPLCGWSDAQLYALAAPRGSQRLWEALVASEPALASMLEGWANAAQGTAYAFLTQVLEVDGRRARFAERFGEEIHEILDELKEQAAAIPSSLAPTVANFCAWIGGSDRQIKRELEAGAHDHVRVMTVHGSKGLEARAVLLVDNVSVPHLKKELFSTLEPQPGMRLPLLALSDLAKQADGWTHTRAGLLESQMHEYQRLLYVALTRAAEDLHVFGIEPSRTPLSPQCWYETVRTALLSLPEHRVMEDGTITVTDAGTRPMPKKHSKPAVPSLPTWARTPVAAPARAAVLSPSNLAAAPAALAPFSIARGEAARERGVRLHRVLQFLQPSMTQEDIAGLVTYLTPDWDDAQRHRATEEIEALYRTHHWIWSDPGEAEASIAGSITIAGQSYAVVGQIDRLVDRGDQLVVLDYKTGRDVPATADAVSEAYLLQLKLYVALLETLYPEKQVRPAIVWTANAQFMWLDEAVASMDWGRAQLPIKP